LIKGIIFNLSYTLLHFNEDWSTVVRQGAEAMSSWYLKKKRIKHDQNELVEAFISERKAGRVLAYQTNQEVIAEDSLNEALKKIKAPQRAFGFIPEATKVYFQFEETHWIPYPDTIETLKQLQIHDYRVGVYTNATDDAFVQRLINQKKLRPWLSPTFSSAEWGWRTPKPEPLIMITKRWGITPAETVVVGDTLSTDILGAQNAGMKTVLITRHQPESNNDYQHIKPTVVIPALSTLPGVLAQL